MKIAILGAGAMGSLFGGRLKASGVDVRLVDVWAEHIEAINSKGLVVEQDGGRQIISIPAMLPAEADTVVDLVIVFTKSMHTEAALAGIRSMLSGRTHVMTLQNGIGHVDIIGRFVDRANIIHGITTYPSDLVGPGHIRTSGEGHIKFMSVDGRSHELLARVDGMLKNAGLHSAVTPGAEVAIWEKLAFNAVMNALAAILRLKVGDVGDAAEGRQLAGRIVEEVVGVARKKGIGVNQQRIMATLEMAFREHRDHMPSMLQDVLHKRPTEIDFINGAVVQAGQAVGLSLPVNSTLTLLMKILEQAEIKS